MGPAAVHDRPEWARERGLIVPSWSDPRDVAVTLVGWPWSGPGFLTCDGIAASPDSLRLVTGHG